MEFSIFILFATPIILNSFIISIASSSDPPSNIIDGEDRFEKWIVQFNRSYPDANEKARRYEIFKRNAQYVDSFNKAQNHTFVLGLNKFSDLTNEEFGTIRGGLVRPANETTISDKTLFDTKISSNIPPSIDWRQKGAVTDVKYQGECESCWAFASVATVESIYQITTGNLVSFSEQQLVDCKLENGGCVTGGWIRKAFEFKIKNGLTTADRYPYHESQGYCDSAALALDPKLYISNYIALPANDERALAQAVANQPVAVGISTECDPFRQYAGGVFSVDCGRTLDHFVVLVGYGTDERTGQKYWIAKNSWGTGWGEKGYMRILRDGGFPEGLCGLAMEAYYPLLSK